jgi:predicted RNase H-like HicB family nuclease
MDEEGYYIVSCPLFRGFHSYGENVDEAVENIREIIEMGLDETTVQEFNKFIGFRELEVAQISKLSGFDSPKFNDGVLDT